MFPSALLVLNWNGVVGNYTIGGVNSCSCLILRYNCCDYIMCPHLSGTMELVKAKSWHHDHVGQTL